MRESRSAVGSVISFPSNRPSSRNTQQSPNDFLIQISWVGNEDREQVLEVADTLEQGIANARKVVIPGTAHHPNMERPEEFNSVVLEFLCL